MPQKISERAIRELAERYNNTPDELNLINEEQLYILKEVVEHQYNHIKKNNFHFYFTDFEPYGQNPKIKILLQDFHCGHLDIHTTGNDSPVWGAYTNLQFRAIHDYLHCVIEAEFDHTNEHRVLDTQITYAKAVSGQAFPFADWDLYYRILRSEIVYQSAYKEAYGAFHIEQKVILSDL